MTGCVRAGAARAHDYEECLVRDAKKTPCTIKLRQKADPAAGQHDSNTIPTRNQQGPTKMFSPKKFGEPFFRELCFVLILKGNAVFPKMVPQHFLGKTILLAPVGFLLESCWIVLESRCLGPARLLVARGLRCVLREMGRAGCSPCLPRPWLRKPWPSCPGLRTLQALSSAPIPPRRAWCRVLEVSSGVLLRPLVLRGLADDDLSCSQFRGSQAGDWGGCYSKLLSSGFVSLVARTFGMT